MDTTDQKDATGITTVASSYEEAVRQAAARRVAAGEIDGPMPDTPTGVAHLNPALTPAPLKAPIPDRTPVPVINDPGVVGRNPSLADLNRQYREDLTGVQPDDTSGITAQGHQAQIKEAAELRQAEIAEDIDKRAAKEVADAERASAGTDPALPAATERADLSATRTTRLAGEPIGSAD